MTTRPLVAVDDDDAIYVEMIRDLLDSEGYDTIAIGQAASAVATIVHVRPALVLLDMRMDLAESGAEVLRLVRANPAVADVPVIVCTADQQFLRSNADFLHAYRATFVAKPFDLDVLLDAINRAMRDEPSTPPSG
jgi:CheY-like chemotaxis protein